MMIKPYAALFLASIALVVPLAMPVMAQETPPGVEVKTVKVIEGEFTDQYEAIGTSRAVNSVLITTNIAEKVQQIHFRGVEDVKQGDLLLVLEHAQTTARVNAAELLVTDERRELARLKRLQKQGAVNEQDVDSKQTDLDIALESVAENKALLAEHFIHAPFDGRLGLRQVDLGEYLQPGDPIVSLDSVDPMLVDFSVPEVWLSAIKTGDKLHLFADAFPNKRIEGQVMAVDTRVDPATRSVVIRANIPNTSGLIRPGQLMRVELTSNPREALIIPETALIPRQYRQYVYRVEDGKVVEQQVEIGGRRYGEVEILKGLEPGQTIITEGLLNVHPGMMVTTIPDKDALPIDSIDENF